MWGPFSRACGLSQGKFELKDAKKVDDVQMSDLINIEDLSF